jgi:hypothetical protein
MGTWVKVTRCHKDELGSETAWINLDLVEFITSYSGMPPKG